MNSVPMKISEKNEARRRNATTLARPTVRFATRRRGTSGCATRVSMTRNAASRTSAPASTPTVRASVQPQISPLLTPNTRSSRPAVIVTAPRTSKLRWRSP